MNTGDGDLTAARATPGDAGDLRPALRSIMVAWLFGSVWAQLAGGVVITRYAQLLALPAYGFGLLAAIPSIAALVQFPTTYFLEHHGRHKAVFIGVGVLHRALWLAVALVPWWLPERWRWPAWLALIFLAGLTAQVVYPIWVYWMAHLVPTRIRGRYFSRRTQLGQFVGLFVVLPLGLLLDWARRTGADATALTITGLLVVASLCGIADFLFFVRVPPPPHAKPSRQFSAWNMLRQPLKDANFRRFLGFSATLTFGTAFMGQFAWLFILDVLGMSNMRANVLMAFVPLVCAMISYPFWGRMIDRLGRKPVLVIAGVLVIHGGAAWLFVSGPYWWIGYASVLLATLAWPGVDLANFNILLGLSGSLSVRRQGGSYVAIYSIVVAGAGVLSGLFAGTVAESMRDWRGAFLGWPLTYHGLLFLLSALLRLSALCWLVGLEDRGAHSTRSAFRYVSSTLGTTLQNTLFIPGRILLSLSRGAYKITPGMPRLRRKP